MRLILVVLALAVLIFFAVVVARADMLGILRANTGTGVGTGGTTQNALPIGIP